MRHAQLCVPVSNSTHESLNATHLLVPGYTTPGGLLHSEQHSVAWYAVCILRRSVCLCACQSAQSFAQALFNPETSFFFFRKRHSYTRDFNSETSDSKNAFLHCGGVIGQYNTNIQT